ncbi:DUF724 domain-containing protein 7-like isoform X9 [Durio zibethinus]|uniref:DUF724 domain-containing protein 7-like isoform X9 n=1 Tax=Durio zibethinus TaxID=66656 RepID=A0A6P5WG61_DURZI|nr:DUF724 domain-containing protein 7-like isoform X9 [Durio zibethinus]XP_022714879.1 DUF724 domain-containing protein 7-like isoform X9 [Durio zibethinus]
MRFKKGTKVEVLIKKEVPTGAWCCGEIIAGNGHTYSVKYGWFPITGEAAMVEKVPRKAIRPCPPPINGTDDWFAGHVIEVFDELCWKPAVIARVLGGNNFSVRIIGSNSELKAHQSRLRVRQSWQDGNWFLVRKVSSSSTRSPKRKRSSLGDIGVQKKRVIDKGCIGGKRIIVRLLIQPLKRISHGKCWGHPYLASKLISHDGLSLSPLAVDQRATSMVYSLTESLRPAVDFGSVFIVVACSMD